DAPRIASALSQRRRRVDATGAQRCYPVAGHEAPCRRIWIQASVTVGIEGGCAKVAARVDDSCAGHCSARRAGVAAEPVTPDEAGDEDRGGGGEDAAEEEGWAGATGQRERGGAGN